MRICYDVLTTRGCGTANGDQNETCSHCAMPLDNALVLHNPGDRVRHYRITRVIGYGRFGAVYEAVAIIDSSVRIALKETLHPDSVSSFRREFESLKHLKHTNLCPYYGTFVQQGRGYLVMELIPGQSLQDVLNQRGVIGEQRRLPLPETLVIGSYAMQLCDALAYLHGQQPPIIHRDIKPANIRVTPQGVIKLVDFGLLKHMGDETHPDIRGIGTVPYAPPEQYGGGNWHTDQRSDIYSLCATLYHLLTGVEPPPAAQRLSASADPLQLPRALNETISPHVSDAIIQGMSLSKKGRFANVELLRHALREAYGPDSRAVRGHTGRILSLALNPNGSMLASGSSSWSVRLWNAPDGRLLHALKGHTGSVNSVAYSPDGHMLVTASSGCTVRLWRADTGAFVSMFQGHRESVRCVAWSPDGHVLASAGDDRLVQLWNVHTGHRLYTLSGHSDSVRSIAWSPDGHVLASGSEDRTLRLWRITSGTLMCMLENHHSAIHSVAWSPDGKLLASAGADCRICLWQPCEGRLVRVLVGHNQPINGLAWSPDGSLLASVSQDRTVRLWKVADGSLLHTYEGHTEAVNTVAYSPDGRVFSGSNDRTLRQWGLLACREMSA